MFNGTIPGTAFNALEAKSDASARVNQIGRSISSYQRNKGISGPRRYSPFGPAAYQPRLSPDHFHFFRSYLKTYSVSSKADYLGGS